MTLDASKLTITNVVQGIPGGAGSGETVYFTYDGQQYRYESWSTDNSSGSDFYELTNIGAVRETWAIATLTHALVEDGDLEQRGFTDDIEEALTYLMDESVLPTYWANWHAIVEPKLEEAAKLTVAECMNSIQQDVADAVEATS